MSFIDNLWYGKSTPVSFALALALSPLSLIYGAVTAARRGLYKDGILKSSAPAVPVVVVGGITVGGSGKTPLCVALLRELAARGFKPGLISRGYHGKAPAYPMEVKTGSDYKESGDEPLLIKRALGDKALVAVDPVRSRGAAFLASLGCDIIVTDDGLQHYALKRDVEIVVLDGARLLGNGLLLPAGPLREGRWHLKRADAVVVNGAHEDENVRFGMSLKPLLPRRLNSDDQNPLPKGPVCMLAGIGNPGRVRATLESLGYTVASSLEVPDHGVCDSERLRAAAASLPVVMTEKDAVKYPRLKHENIYVFKVEACLSAGFFKTVTDKVKASAEKIALRAPRKDAAGPEGK